MPSVRTAMIAAGPRGGVLALLVCFAAACVDHLPDQDLRITAASPSAKLSAADLWKEFASDAGAARSRYFGNAVDVTDRITTVAPDPPGPHLFFAQDADRGVRARLLDERATATLKDVKTGDRITLRCFVEGIDADGNVLLKSCIRP